ncbi:MULTISPECIES: hypothetical protein [Brenneria]|uniref:hypothetical protein n=1 Tax=Brenneria TaxID=71655 RepID=UPI00022F7BC3|nr:hypothetical protein BrE312_1502 [Brenneria sp. EniD312]
MDVAIPGVDVLFVAGFGPIVKSAPASYRLYVDTLGLPLKPLEGNSDYLTTDKLVGVTHTP